MSLIFPNGRPIPGKKVRESLTKAELDAVESFEAWCIKRGIVLDLFCRKCLDDGFKAESRIQGNNVRNSLGFHLTCAHCDRVYGDAPTR